MNVAFSNDVKALIARVKAIADDAGLETYIVGGSVRDALLHREIHDLDLAVDGDAFAFARRSADSFDGHFVTLDDVNAIARVVLDDDVVRYIDVAQLQGSFEEDMRRRDFTIDALAVPLGDELVIDVVGGLADLDAKLVRMNSEYVFDEDPLRLLRAVRIASDLKFAIEPASLAAVRQRASDVLKSAAERQRDELARIFALDDAYSGVRLLDDCRLLEVVLPEVAASRGVTQPGAFHAYDVFEHAMRAVEALDVMLSRERPLHAAAWIWDDMWAVFDWQRSGLRAYLDEKMSEGRSRAMLLKLATLLHDVAKPQTQSTEADGRVRFLGHPDAGADVAAKIMRRLRFSAREVRFVTMLVAEHLRPVQLAAVGDVPTRRALYRFHRDLGEAVPGVLLLALADAASARGLTERSDPEASRGWTRHVRYMNSIVVRSEEEEGILDPPRLLSGDDIMREFGVSEGPDVGRLLEAIREAQAVGEVDGVDGARALVRRLIERPAR